MALYQGSHWTDFMSKVHDEFEKKESLDFELSSTFSNLSQLLEKKSLLHWHIKSFKDYIAANLNPFGLRVQIFPTFEHIDPSFKAVWEVNLKECSRKMMLLLIDEYAKRIVDIDGKLEKLQNQMSLLRTHVSFSESEERLKRHLEQFNKDILIKKDKKLQRDRKAFEDGRAYKWQTNTSNNFSKKTQKK